MRTSQNLSLVGTLAVAALFAPSAAQAFSLETSVSKGCHERITARAQANAGWPAGLTAPEADAAIVSNVAFKVPAGADAWTVALIIGVRDNDLRGAQASNFHDLNETHNSAGLQSPHCLRAPADDGEEGNRKAVLACKVFIQSEIALALAALENDETEEVPVGLRYQETKLELSGYAFHMGRAIHALQDSFAHGLRTDDFRSVATVFNYAEPALSSDYQEERDGVEHQSHLDDCDGADGQPAPRALAAEQASTELLSAVNAAGPTEARAARASAVLDSWLQVHAGCTAANDYCGEGQQIPVAQGCSVAGGAPSLLALIALVVASRKKKAA